MTAPSTSLDELALRARSGDAAARNLLWEQCGDVVRGAVARQRGLPRLWERADLEQEVFIVFAEFLDAWQGSGFRDAMEREFAGALLRHVRRARRKQYREVSIPSAVHLGGDPYPARLYALTELLEGLSQLPEPARFALQLHLFLGLSLAEVGRRLGMSRRAVVRLVPLAQSAVAVLETREERLGRLLEALYALTDDTGRIRANKDEVRTHLGLSVREYTAFIADLEGCGVLTVRSRGHAGRLPAAGPKHALLLLRDARRTGAA